MDKRTVKISNKMITESYGRFCEVLGGNPTWRSFLLRQNGMPESCEYPMEKGLDENYWGTPELFGMLEAINGPHGETILKAYRVRQNSETKLRRDRNEPEKVE